MPRQAPYEFPEEEPYRTQAMAEASVAAAIRGVVNVYARGDRRAELAVRLTFLRHMLIDLAGMEIGSTDGEEGLRESVVDALEYFLPRFREPASKPYVVHDGVDQADR
jgi:hypothetical protein